MTSSPDGSNLPGGRDAEKTRRPAEVSEGHAAAAVEEKPSRKPRPPTLFYLGYRATGDGREYALQVRDGRDDRIFVMFIPHEVFSSRQLSFQDAPGLCFARLQKDLVENPDLVPGERRKVCRDELREFHSGHEQPTLARRRRGSA